MIPKGFSGGAELLPYNSLDSSIGCILLNLEIAFALVGNSFRHGFAVPPPSVREAFASMKAFCFFAILCSFQAGGEEERSVITSFTEMCKDMVYSF